MLAYATDQASADAAADRLLAFFEDNEGAFAGKAWTPEEGVREAMRLAATASRPVVIADTQDNPGAGGDSNTAGMLRALVSEGATRAALGLMVDPDAAAAVHAAGIGAEIELTLGGRTACLATSLSPAPSG